MIIAFFKKWIKIWLVCLEFSQNLIRNLTKRGKGIPKNSVIVYKYMRNLICFIYSIIMLNTLMLGVEYFSESAASQKRRRSGGYVEDWGVVLSVK